MLWDKYVKSIDRRIQSYGADPQISEALRETEHAAVFDCGVIDIGTTIEGPEHPDRFFLPFEHTCVEWECQINGKRYGRVLVFFGKAEDSTADLRGESWNWMVAQQSDESPDLIRLIKGFVRWQGTGPSARLIAQLFSVCTYEIRSGACVQSWCSLPEAQSLQPLTEDQIRTHANMLGNLARAAARAIEQANSPANWIVRVEDTQARVVKRRGKKDKQRRVRYIVVPDRSIERVLHLPNPESDKIKRAPHRRRAHWRRLNAERFRLKRGQRVLVKASWIGPKTAVHGGERYTVLTELPSYEEA